jgi:putative inorganic carbon (hco3(-)) transporter
MREASTDLLLRESSQAWKGGNWLRPLTLLALLIPPLVVGFLVWNQFNMGLVLAGIVALAVLAVMFAQPEATTVIVLFVIYANLMAVAVESYNVPSALAASVVLLLGLPLMHYLLVRRQPIVFNRILWVMLAYLGVLLISAAASGEAANSIARIRDFLLEGLLLYLLILNTVRTPAVLRLSLWALILAGVLMGSISLYQELTGSYDHDFGGLSVTNDAQMNTGQVDSFGNPILRGRLAGPVGEKNRYAQIMVVLLPLALSRLWAERAWWLRLLGGLSAIPILAGALLTFSRGAGLAIVFTLLVMVAIRTIRWWQLLLMVGIGYLFISLAVPDYLYRMTTAANVVELATGNAAEADGSVQGRATENLATLLIFLDHPLLGVGPGQTSRHMLEYSDGVGFRRLEGNRRGHNLYLEELADTGLVGFGLLLTILAITLHQLLRVRRQWPNDSASAQTAAALFLALMAYLATAFFLHLSYVRYFWLILALAAAAYEVLKRKQFQPLPAETIPGP